MEIAVPEGCTLRSIFLQTDSQDVFDALVAEHDGRPFGGEHVHHGAEGRAYQQQNAYWDDGYHYMLEGPKRYVTVTIADA